MILQDCIKELIKIEENASELYDKEVSKIEEKFKPVMIILTNEELKHRKDLFKLLKKRELLDYVLNKEIVECLDSQKEHLTRGFSGQPSQKEFFKFALQLEKNSAELYEKLAATITLNYKHENIFSKLVLEEKRHMIFILNMLHEMS